MVACSIAAAAVADPGIPVPPPPPPTAPQPEAGTPHLASPDALPPGATMDPNGQGTETPNLSYLKDLWHAVQNQEISGKEALILGVAQRGMNTPVPEQAPGPNVPISPDAPDMPAAPAGQ
ncbi:hypothetical protein M1247_15685 [Mycobacterium sp. 21AC1]|nr:hypothetical protein [Mycobacterium sp. 21AC1]